MKYNKATTEIAIFICNIIYCSRDLHGDILGLLLLYAYLTFINMVFIIFDIIWEFVVCKGVIDYYNIKFNKKIPTSPLLIFSSIFIYVGVRYYIEGGISIATYLPVLIPKFIELVILSIKINNNNLQ